MHLGAGTGCDVDDAGILLRRCRIELEVSYRCFRCSAGLFNFHVSRTLRNHLSRAILSLTLAQVTAIQILWINLITAITLGIALAFEPTEENTMRRPPRPRNEALISGNLAWHIVLVSLLFLACVFGIYSYATDKGHSPELARSMALNSIVVLEIFHLFFIRNIYGTSLTWKAIRGTRVVWTTVIIITVAQFAITYLPPLQAVFGTEPVPFLDGLVIIGVGVVFFAVLEIEKQMRLVFQRTSTG